jgi:RNA 3'-terminal phosphate cyclase (ATP)
MLEVDGSDGGGQLVRSALTFAALTGTPVELRGVRGDRPEPGLKPQHLAAVEAVAAVTDASVTGADEGATTFRFDPGEPSGGHYEVAIDTAGSATLVVDAVLPLAARLDEPLSLAVAGGTDVAWSPSVDALRRVKLPLLRRQGVHAAVEVERRGFYPVGGGRLRLWLAPSDVDPLALESSGTPETAQVHAVESADLADADVADRLATAAADWLRKGRLDVAATHVETAGADCTGAAVLVRLDARTPDGSLVPAGFDALGEPGVPAEDVAETAVDAALDFRDGPGVVDRHVADQLVPFLALAGGAVAVPEVTDHVRTHCDLVAAFGYPVEVDADGGRGGAVLRATRATTPE